MKVDNSINRKCLLWFLLLTLILMGYLPAYSQSSVYGDFPYYQSFSSTLRPGEVSLPGAPSGTNAAAFTNNGVMLTPALENRFGAIFINNRKFSSKQGIRIEFEYLMYGGTRGEGGDGISCFFFDAAESAPSIGSTGGGLGYRYRRTNNETPGVSGRNPGLKSAYIGIALDGFGNFKAKMFRNNVRVNGIDGYPSYIDDDPPAEYRHHVTLRGAQGFSLGADGRGEGYTGYPVLITQPVGAASYKSARVLNDAGGYDTRNLYSGPTFNIRSGEYFNVNETSKSSYRKAIIEMYPRPSGDGMSVTVKIQHGETTSTIINDYQYKNNIKYTENANASGGDYNNYNTPAPNAIIPFNVPQAEFYRIGFAAATGGFFDNHMIRELKITLPGGAVAKDDRAATSRNASVSVDVLANDLGYTGAISKDQVGSSAHLNPYSFIFCDKDGKKIGTTSASQATCTTPTGTWTFNFSTRNLTFTPNKDVVGGTDIYYSIKAGKGNETPYNDEAYRSLPARVSIEIKDQEVVPELFLVYSNLSKYCPGDTVKFALATMGSTYTGKHMTIWEWGDKKVEVIGPSLLTGVVVPHVYEAPGDYKVIVTVVGVTDQSPSTNIKIGGDHCAPELSREAVISNKMITSGRREQE